jgi:hypothetical protein
MSASPRWTSHSRSSSGSPKHASEHSHRQLAGDAPDEVELVTQINESRIWTTSDSDGIFVLGDGSGRERTAHQSAQLRVLGGVHLPSWCVEPRFSFVHVFETNAKSGWSRVSVVRLASRTSSYFGEAPKAPSPVGLLGPVHGVVCRAGSERCRAERRQRTCRAT